MESPWFSQRLASKLLVLEEVLVVADQEGQADQGDLEDAERSQEGDQQPQDQNTIIITMIMKNIRKNQQLSPRVLETVRYTQIFALILVIANSIH